jgi:hypothetical protein
MKTKSASFDPDLLLVNPGPEQRNTPNQPSSEIVSCKLYTVPLARIRADEFI